MAKLKKGPENFAYTKIVKERLLSHVSQIMNDLSIGSLNYSGISDALEQRYHVVASPSLLREMLSPGIPRDIRIDVVVAFCDLFNISLYEILAFPEENICNVSSDTYRLFRGISPQENGIQKIASRYYMEDYYCYYFEPKHHVIPFRPLDSTPVQEARLSIKLVDGKTKVTFSEIKTNTAFDGEPMQGFTLTGQLIWLDHSSIAYVNLMDEKAQRNIILMFKYLHLSQDIRYFIPASMTTFSLNQVHEPIFQKMAIFRVRQDLENEDNTDILRGLLSLNTGPMIFDPETLEALKQDPVIEKLLNAPKLENCSVFVPEAVMSSADFITDENELAEIMLKLRRNSLYTNHQIVSETEIFTGFIKDYQTKHPNYPNYLAEKEANNEL